MPVDRSAIDAQLREIGEGERWWEQREFRALPHILNEGERILGLGNGKLLGRRRPRLAPTAPWLLVVTDQRLICLKQERFARKHVEFTRDQIVRVGQGSRLRSFQISIETPQRKYRILISKDDAFRFTGALAPLIPAPAAHRLGPDLGPWGWIPGLTAVAALPGVADIVSNVLLLSPPDDSDHGQLQRLEATVERLQNDVERLQQQVGFLEDLLQNRADEAFLPKTSPNV